MLKNLQFAMHTVSTPTRRLNSGLLSHQLTDPACVRTCNALAASGLSFLDDINGNSTTLSTLTIIDVSDMLAMITCESDSQPVARWA